MIRCSCGQIFEHDQLFENHRDIMDSIPGEKNKHKLLCSKCGKDGLLPSFSYAFQACGKIWSIIHDDCYQAIVDRIANDGYPPGKRR